MGGAGVSPARIGRPTTRCCPTPARSPIRSMWCGWPTTASTRCAAAPRTKPPGTPGTERRSLVSDPAAAHPCFGTARHQRRSPPAGPPRRRRPPRRSPDGLARQGNSPRCLRHRRTRRCRPVLPAAGFRPSARVLPAGGQPARPDPRPPAPPRSPTGITPVTPTQPPKPSTISSNESNESVRVPELRQLPDPGSPLRREAQLEAVPYPHSPLKSEGETVNPFGRGKSAYASQVKKVLQHPLQQLVNPTDVFRLRALL